MQLSVLCIDKKLKENFWYAFEKNLCNFKNISEENNQYWEDFLRYRSYFHLLTGTVSDLMVMIQRMRWEEWNWEHIDLSFLFVLRWGGRWRRQGNHTLCVVRALRAKWHHLLFPALMLWRLERGYGRLNTSPPPPNTYILTPRIP